MTPLTVGSLFAGIGGFDLGLERAGLEIRWQVEADPDCRKVLMRRFPSARSERDVNAFAYGRATNRAKHGLLLDPVDVVVGGFPCQDLSVAGQRKGLGGSRSGLFFAFMRILRLLNPQPRVVVIENVPGLFSSACGRDFHTVLAAVAERGFRRAYRVLDSQYFGIPQRRRRVFVVGCLRTSGLDPYEILFESAGGGRGSQASGQTRARVAATLRGRSANTGVNAPGRGGEDDSNLICFDWQSGGDVRLNCSSSSSSLQASQTPAVAFGVHANQRGEVRTSDLAGSLNGSRSGKQFEGVYQCHGSNVGEMGTLRSGNGTVTGWVPFVAESGESARALTGSMFKRHDDDTDTLIASPVTASAGHHGHSSPRGDGRDNLIAATWSSGGHDGWFRTEPGEHLVAWKESQSGVRESDVHATLDAHEGSRRQEGVGVRRLTPLECERLQGFPDGWTCLCGNGHHGSQSCACPDTPRYKQLGNAVSVPVAEWIGRRIRAAEDAGRAVRHA